MIQVTNKVVFGSAEQIDARLADSSVSNTINTSFVERDNLSLRTSNRRLTRKTNAFSKEMSWLEKQLWLSLAYYHLVLPHQGLRQQLSTPVATLGNGSPQCWRERTPATAVGITDHMWTTRELLSYRVPVRFLNTISKLESLFPPPD